MTMTIPMTGQELKNSGASTSDWIGQTEDKAIYSFDLSNLVSQNTKGTPIFTKNDFEQALRKVSRRGKVSQIH